MSKEFESVQMREVPRNFEQYQVYYSLDFKTPEAAAEAKTSVTPASGQATVQWHSAQIRKGPEQEEDVQARLLAGARVVVTGRMGEWYRVKYDAKGREGWIHGAALGLK
jgi:SH3-like domain-containing protein